MRLHEFTDPDIYLARDSGAADLLEQREESNAESGPHLKDKPWLSGRLFRTLPPVCPPLRM